jgi:HlyD family secretion protein
MTALSLVPLALLLTLSLSPPSLQAQASPPLLAQAAVADATRQPAGATLPDRGTPSATLVGSQDRLIFEAALAPAVSATVYARQSGIVDRVLVEPAQSVAAGDTLAALDECLLRQRCHLDAAHREGLQTRFRQAQLLAAQGMIAAYELERLEHEAKRADLSYRETALTLSQLVLTAPISGIVSQVQVLEGAPVSTGQPCFRLIDPTDLQVELHIPMDRLGQVRVDQQVTARLEPSTVLEGRILRLAPVIDPDTGSRIALVRFPSAGHAVLPGSVARITVVGQ